MVYEELPLNSEALFINAIQTDWKIYPARYFLLGRYGLLLLVD